MALVDAALDVNFLLSVQQVEGAETQHRDQGHDDGDVERSEQLLWLEDLLKGKVFRLREGRLNLHGVLLLGAGWLW